MTATKKHQISVAEIRPSSPLRSSSTACTLYVQIPSVAHLAFCCEYYLAFWWSPQHTSFSELNYMGTSSSREVPCFSSFRIQRTQCKGVANEMNYFRRGSQVVLFKWGGKWQFLSHMDARIVQSACFKETEIQDTKYGHHEWQMPVENPLKSG